MSMGKNSRKCLCEICNCGLHKCPQAYEKELPKQLQKFEYVSTKKNSLDTEQNKQNYETYIAHPKIDLYNRSIYKQDYDAPKTSSFNQTQPVKFHDNLKCENDPLPRKSMYSQSFKPYPDDIIKLCEAKSCNPNQDTDPIYDSKSLILFSKFNSKDLYCLRKYYCPSHCIRTEKQDKNIDYLKNYRNKISLNRPKNDTPVIKLPDEPFPKYTNYMLDYIAHKPQRRKIEKLKMPEHEKPTSSISSETSYRNDFNPPPPNVNRKVFNANQTDKKPGSNVIFNEGEPMTTQSSSMIDYQDPIVSQRKIVRLPKAVFHPPQIKMETDTTTSISYPRWTELIPNQLEKVLQRESSEDFKDNERRCIFSIYQQDYSGLQEALCLAKLIEKCGHSVLEPRYKFVGDGNDHEYYQHRNEKE